MSRSLPTDKMQAELTPIFNRLKKLNALIMHYKFCSTFDSSTDIGSIGRAIEIGAEIFQSGVVPVIVGAPALGRYVAFGNLFARSGGNSEVFRIDRHPTMSRHPVTPMNEADLIVHLSRQTSLPITLISQPEITNRDIA